MLHDRRSAMTRWQENASVCTESWWLVTGRMAFRARWLRNRHRMSLSKFGHASTDTFEHWIGRGIGTYSGPNYNTIPYRDDHEGSANG